MSRFLAICCLFLGLFPSAVYSQDKVEEKKTEVKKKYDFGDYTSTTLTTKAWDAHNAKKSKDAIVFAQECIKRYEVEALKMQKALDAPVTGTKDEVGKQWALNDVGTCYLIKGLSFEQLKKPDEAIKAYKTLQKKVPFAQCWDPKGWYWKPVDAAKKSLKKLEFEKLEREGK